MMKGLILGCMCIIASLGFVQWSVWKANRRAVRAAIRSIGMPIIDRRTRPDNSDEWRRMSFGSPDRRVRNKGRGAGERGFFQDGKFYKVEDVWRKQWRQ